jgi:preprotein translocase subunit SecA
VRAHCLYEKDVQYVVEENKVIIVDEHTGRKMPGRRWSDGLHQAVEAKEGVQIEKETQTLATITVQNYFRLYTKLAGMTGTAETEASEFLDIYNLGVMVIPTNQPCLRIDGNDTVYKTQREKFDAALAELQEEHRKGRPILVGTSTVETSERFSKILKKAGIIHSVLNAKFHQQEAEIVARAGQRGSVTIATNMAGRGTDIKLGPGVAELGGLHVIGTERHESRRIDRQLRGRCARQGDPGSSHFFISLEDNLMRLFASDWVQKVMERGLEDGQPLESPLLNRAIEQAQKRVESNYFQRRKRTLEYDDVMNKQREVIYGFRNEIIQAEDTHGRMMEILEEGICWKVDEHLLAELDMDNWNIKGFVEWTQLNFPLGWNEEQVKQAANGVVSEEDIADHLYIQSLSDPKQQAIALKLLKEVQEAYNLKASFEEEGFIRALERYTILSSIDRRWQEHLYSMDGLRESIGLRAYGQKDPLLEYKSEAFSEFESLMESIKLEIVHSSFRSASSQAAYQKFLSHLPRNKDSKASSTTLVAESSTTTSSSSSSAESRETITPAGSGAPVKDTSPKLDDQELASEVSAILTSRGSESSSPKKPGIKKKPAPVKADPDAKVKRNSACPCGSGKKYKNCCGAVG